MHACAGLGRGRLGIRTPELGCHLPHCLAQVGPAKLHLPLVKWKLISTGAVLGSLHIFSDLFHATTLRRSSNSFVVCKKLFLAGKLFTKFYVLKGGSILKGINKYH